MPTTKCGFNDHPSGLSGQDALIRWGPTLHVQIGFDPGYRRSDTLPDLPSETYHALVDTGALESCIDSQLAAALCLPIVGRQRISGALGADEVNLHLAQIYVPSLSFVQYGLFAAVHLLAGGQKHVALIGRTFLRYFNMTYEGQTGTVILSNDP